MKTLVIGAAIIDMILQVERVPASGEDVLGQNLRTMVGGCAYNVAITLRNLSCEHDLCVPVGEGAHADIIKKELKKKGYPVLIHDEEKDNGFCFCLVEKSGERTFITAQGIEGEFRKKWFENIDMSEYGNVYLAGYQACGENGKVMAEWLSGLKEIDIYFAPGPVICDIEKDTMKQILALHPILHLNEKELLDFTEEDTVKQGLEVLYRMTQNRIIVTLGSKGAICWDGKNLVQAPAMKAQMVDTIGAGDSHIGAVLACISQGKSMEESLNVANRVAAAVVSVQGAVISKEEFEKKMEEYR